MASGNDKAITQSFWLPREVVDWLKARGERNDRSASWELTQILRTAMAIEREEEAA